ncbi:C4-dicarboxylate ABC transporter substrate-binding protein [Brevibacterium jeotgali]|uniref:TRAP-type C4-dicarboxylate transport system, substrate-binding protein n=1 Tax=Brevibacterium jeotgali TaxID=1262550 RepID=A0A2H1L2L9_9MICO|nr:C4-dicarboxylate ABC transporter substrate-binding protein [Brevibacterium jeotgali]TWC02353.1 TRAP-type C4-dicarboxylate transport system substrate-binding protein [Brevibacterium jeotgali]SMY11147.1 TRAP-type C4-dicarboxylate transport system, substrate-binding protein [Brevibacterium jeotgali]
MHSRTLVARTVIAGTAALAVSLTGCAGAAGSGGTGGGGSGDGYEYGASTEEIRAAFEDIDPITISYQPSAQSAEDITSYRSKAFIEDVEELSGGAVTVETTYGQGIAGYTDLADALVDGRVDVAYMLPVYQPDQFPVFAGFVAASTLTGTSPLVDELAANAALGEMAWGSEDLLNEYRDQGLHPLNPFNAAGAIMGLCSDEVSTLDEWSGKQVRISSGAQITQLEGLGGSPTSLEYTETYEALQRGTVDCTLSATLPATTSGFLEVAPNVSYTDEVTFARGPGATVAGSAFESYPLAVKQLLFDAMLRNFNTSRRADLEGNSQAAQQVREFDGSFQAMAEDAEDSLKEASQGVVQAEVEKGSLPESAEQDVADLMERWSGVAEELGYADDEGEFEDYDEWYTSGQDYLMPYSQRYFDEVMLPHRPS